jgi:hypothetical protein
MRHSHCCILSLSALLTLSSIASAQETPLVKSAATSCAALMTLTLNDARVDQATVVEPTPQARAAGRGVLCRVAGTIGTETHFVALLPDTWNRRFVMGGGGGFVGAVENMGAFSVNRGFATVGTDAGHQAQPISAAWALNNRTRLIDYAYEAVHRTAVVSKAIIQAYYGVAPERSYFYGCSNGGREALMEAQRYPDDFDGIVAIAPVINWVATAASFLRNLQALYPTGAFTTPALPRATLMYLERQVLAVCDGRDGVTDDIINDPRACDFAVSSLAACPNDIAGADCVTGAQRAAIQQVYAPVSYGDRVVYHGQPVGNEGAPGGWFSWIVGPDSSTMAMYRVPAAQAGFATEFFKYFVFGDSLWDYRTYDIRRAVADTRDVNALLSPNSADLSAFAKRGGKLLLAHGWSDPALNALETIDYLEAVKKEDSSADAYVRLFLMPGVLHCAGGTGCDEADWLTAISHWVETGAGPDWIVASRFGPAAGGLQSAVLRTRPLCAYPRQAVYSGTGSTDEAQNFVCR